MKSYPIKQVLALILSALLAFSCSGCGSGTILAGGGMGGSGFISKGVILAFGSIIVNGTEFDTTDAIVMVDGEEVGVGNDAVLSNLDLGKYVTVIGTGSEAENTAVAEKVIYNSNLKGPVEGVVAVDERTKEITVMGQAVRINSLTEFKNTGFDTISVNDIVEISGMFDNDGVIWATFIEKTGDFTPGTLVEVTGYVENLNLVEKTFQIKNLIVDYFMADTENLPGGLPAEGLYVEAEGTVAALGDNLMAVRIELTDELEVTDADQIEVMGFVTAVVSESEFNVGNQRVQIDDIVEYVDGEPEDIVPGVKLEAEGMLVDGVLHAWEIEFWGPDQIEHEDIITSMVSITEFSVGNQVVHTNDETIFEDGTPEDLSLGINVEIKGRMIDGILVADKVSFEPE